MKTGDTFDFVIDGISYSAKIESIKKEKENTKIDWSKMPKDMLVEAYNSSAFGTKGYFKRFVSREKYSYGIGDSTIDDSTVFYKKIRLIENDWRPWFGGEMPCCGNVTVEVLLRCGGDTDIKKAYLCRWNHIEGHREFDVIAYKMLAEEGTTYE